MNSFQRTDLIVNWMALLASAVVMLLSFWLRADEAKGILLPGVRLPLPPLCSSRMLLGIECPGCGLTRAFVAISHGSFGRAWELNRASFAMYAFVLAQIPWHAVQIWRISCGRQPMFWPVVYYVPIGLAVLLVVNWILKFAGW